MARRPRSNGWPRRGAFAVVLASLLSLPIVATAQQALRPAPGVLAQLERVHFRVQAGRIRCSSDTLGGRLSFGARSLGRQENLTVDLSTESPSLEYTLSNRKVAISINITDGERIAASSRPHNSTKGVPMTFEQQPASALALVVGEDEAQATYRADSLWRLLLAEPDVAAAHLVPALQCLRPGWALIDQANEIERMLLASEPNGSLPNREELAALVAQLGDDDFRRRREADRRLREFGNSALSYLQGLDRSQLDAEQQFRIRKLIERLGGAEGEDTPPLVARRLSSDPQTWLALMRRDDSLVRRRASEQLARLLCREIRFDADAAPAVRADQLTAIEDSLGKNP